MDNAKTAKRRRLHQLYAANLAIFKPNYPKLFACPVCLGCYPEAAVEPESLEVDIAHVFPESCGGFYETLTCKTCNSDVGSKYDYHIAQELKLADAFGGSGRAKVTARLHFGDLSIGVEAQRKGDHFHFQEIKQITNPKASKEIIENIQKTGEVNCRLTALAFDPARLKVAMLHSAYLALFHQFGYEYVFGTETQWLRDLFAMESPPEKPPGYHIDIPKGMMQDIDPVKAMHTVGVAILPNGSRFFAIIQPTPDPSRDVRIVLLPGFGNDAKAQYDQLPDGELKIRYFVDMFPPAPRLSEPKWDKFARWVFFKAGNE